MDQQDRHTVRRSSLGDVKLDTGREPYPAMRYSARVSIGGRGDGVHRGVRVDPGHLYAGRGRCNDQCGEQQLGERHYCFARQS